MDHQRDTADRQDPADDRSVLAPVDADTGPGTDAGASEPPRRVCRIVGRQFREPASRPGRRSLGAALSVLGLFGFLPVLGFWMIPLGLFILSHELHPLRRLRRRLAVRRARRSGANRPPREPVR